MLCVLPYRALRRRIKQAGRLLRSARIRRVGTVTFELDGPHSGTWWLVVTDSVGREIARTELVAGSSWRVDVSSWAPGVYHAHVEGLREVAESVSFTVVR